MKKSILVVNGSNYSNAISALEGEYDFVYDLEAFFAKPDNFALVMFTGGADVSPSLYGHTSPNNVCMTNSARDVQEVAVFDLARETGIPMTGICRGSQLINVLCGGVMMHHISNHGIGGYHTMLANTDGEEFEVTSTHHQMSVVGKGGVVVGWSSPKRSDVFIGDEDLKVEYSGPETEAIYYPDHKCFAVQYHPEYMPKNSAGYKWYLQGVTDLLNLSKEDFTKKYTATKENKA